MEGPTILLGDNNSVVLNVSLPSSTLKKKHNLVAFHRIREAVAAQVITFWYIATALNLADLLTKILGRTKHMGFTKPIMFRTSKPSDESAPNAATGATAIDDTSPTQPTNTKATGDLHVEQPESIEVTPNSERRGVSNKTVTFSLDNPDVREMAGRPAISTPSAFSQS